MKTVTKGNIRLNAEANLNLNLRLPFIYNKNGPSETPDSNCFNFKGSFFRVNADFSGNISK